MSCRVATASALGLLLILALSCSSSSSATRSSVCDPGSRQDCTCDNGTTGTSTCLPSGGYDACVCDSGSAGSAGASGAAGASGQGNSGASGGSAGGGGAGAGGGGAGTGGEGGGGNDCVVQMVAGSYHTCALSTDGTVWCWGGNQPTPTAVTGLANVAEIASGTFHTCARKVDGTLWCWGNNPAGQLGDGTTENRAEPVQVSIADDMETFIAVAAGGFTTCARAQGGAAYCWGANESGQVGNGTTETPQLLPVAVSVAGPLLDIVPAGGNTCIRNPDSSLSCWGSNENGGLGDGTTELGPKLVPSPVANLGVSVVRYTARCAIRQELSLWCWGWNASGQLGDGTTVTPTTPVRVTALGDGVLEVTQTFAKTCARKSDGTAWCWGRNDAGSLGDGELGGLTCPNGECKPTPVQVSGLSDVVAIAAGIAHACAAKGDGTIWCWGANGQGQLGDGTTEGDACPQTTCRPLPVQTLFSCP